MGNMVRGMLVAVFLAVGAVMVYAAAEILVGLADQMTRLERFDKQLDNSIYE